MTMRTEIVISDITTLSADAIVNAANSSLLGGGGVDGAIHRAAGPRLREACIPLQGCKTGEAKITPGFGLPARWVIHTVGPIWQGGEHGEPELLARCYTNALQVAQAAGCRTIAFPAISTGVFRFPKGLAAQIALRAVRQWARDHEGSAFQVQFCFNNVPDAVIFQAEALGHAEGLCVFLDDERPTPEGWVRTFWPNEVIQLLLSDQVATLSLDHDLGDDRRGTGYDVIAWIEEAVITRGFRPPRLRVHSANAPAKERMQAGIRVIERAAQASDQLSMIRTHR